MNQSKKPLPPKLLWSDGDKRVVALNVGTTGEYDRTVSETKHIDRLGNEAWTALYNSICLYSKSFAEGSPDVYEHSKEVLEAARDWYDKAANPPRDSFESAKLTTGEFNEP